MKRPTRLSATFVNTVNVPGRYGDGRGGYGLSLLVKPATHGGFSKSWAQRIRLDGKAANVGLGAYPVVTLARARQKALANARIVSEGRDPRDRAGRAPNFEQAVETVIEIHAENWKDGGKSAAQWRASLRDYAVPKIDAEARGPHDHRRRHGGPASATGQPRGRTCRARCANSPWRTSTAIVWRLRTGVQICSNAAAN